MAATSLSRVVNEYWASVGVETRLCLVDASPHGIAVVRFFRQTARAVLELGGACQRSDSGPGSSVASEDDLSGASVLHGYE